MTHQHVRPGKQALQRRKSIADANKTKWDAAHSKADGPLTEPTPAELETDAVERGKPSRHNQRKDAQEGTR